MTTEKITASQLLNGDFILSAYLKSHYADNSHDPSENIRFRASLMSYKSDDEQSDKYHRLYQRIICKADSDNSVTPSHAFSSNADISFSTSTLILNSSSLHRVTNATPANVCQVNENEIV